MNHKAIKQKTTSRSKNVAKSLWATNGLRCQFLPIQKIQYGFTALLFPRCPRCVIVAGFSRPFYALILFEADGSMNARKRREGKPKKNRKGQKKMKRTQRFERRLKDAQEGNEIEVLETYKREIDMQRKRMNATKNGFIKTCCRQESDELKSEKAAIEAEVVG